MNITPEQKRKMLAVAEIVDGGDMAVMKKIFEFMDCLEEYTEKFKNFTSEVDTSVSEAHKQMMTEMNSELEKMMGEIKEYKEAWDEKVADLYEKSDKSEIFKALEEIKQRFAPIFEKIESVRKEIPELPEPFNPTYIYEKISQVESKIPTLPEPVILDTPEQLRDKLETLQDSNRLSISAIHDLEERLDELKKQIWSGSKGGGGFSKIAMDSHIIDDETPTGTVNGINTAFVLAGAPNPSSSLKVFINGQRLKLTTDYTFSVKTITFLTAPQVGDIISVDYRN